MNKKRLVVTLWAGLTALLSLAQKSQNNALESYFINYKAAGQLIRSKSHLDSLIVNDSLKTVTVYANNAFGEQLLPSLRQTLSTMMSGNCCRTRFRTTS